MIHIWLKFAYSDTKTAACPQHLTLEQHSHMLQHFLSGAETPLRKAASGRDVHTGRAAWLKCFWSGRAYFGSEIFIRFLEWPCLSYFATGLFSHLFFWRRMMDHKFAECIFVLNEQGCLHTGMQCVRQVPCSRVPQPWAVLGFTPNSTTHPSNSFYKAPWQWMYELLRCLFFCKVPVVSTHMLRTIKIL